MGITALWETVKRYEEIVPLAQLAEEHHRQYGKPLRIAIDEADWRFNNLSPQQVFAIREKSNQHAFQGIEKAMFYRICRFLTLNIQLIFVFDGPSRPWKRGKRGQGKIDYEKRRLLQSVLNCLGIPYHEAPGEAEAECARLQILGIVDAVWSQDSDTLMFGCTLLLNDYRVAKEKGNNDQSKENTKKSGKYARVIQAREIREKHGLDREGLVLFAMLVGGDYDTKGLPGCGPSTALQAIKQGLGKSLCACRDQKDCNLWSRELDAFLETRRHSITVPLTFPDYKTLHKYNKPKVTDDHILVNLSSLKLDSIRPIQELKLLDIASQRFNMWGRLYMNWVGPILLMRDLVGRDLSRPKKTVHDIRLAKQRFKKGEEPVRTLERKLTFSPFGVTELCRADFEGDRLGYWEGDKETLFDPEYRVECEIPEYWLRKVLPPVIFETSTPAPKRTPKRKCPTDDSQEDTETPTVAKRKRLSNQDSHMPYSAHSRGSTQPTVTPSESQNTPMSKATRELLSLIELSESEEEVLPSPPTARPTASSSKAPNTSRVIDLDTPEPTDNREHVRDGEYFDISDEEDEELQLALRLSMQDQAEGSLPLPYNKGSYDDIFALREAGRNVQGYSVPAWSLDQPFDGPSASTTPQPLVRQASGTSTQRSAGPSRGTHANAIGPVDVSDWSFASPSTSDTRKPVKLPSNSALGYDAGVSISSPSQITLAEIRAARLQRFAASPSVAIQQTNTSHTLPVATQTTEQRTSPYKVPSEIEYIDLTDD